MIRLLTILAQLYNLTWLAEDVKPPPPCLKGVRYSAVNVKFDLALA